MSELLEWKQAARTILKGRRGLAALLALLPWLPDLLIGITEQLVRWAGKLPAFLSGNANPALPSMLLALLTAILWFVLSAPLQQGAYQWYWNLSNGSAGPAAAIFSCFEHWKTFWRAAALHFGIFLRMCLWALLLAALPIAIMVFRFLGQTLYGGLEELGAFSPFLWLLPVLWSIPAVMLLCIARLRYFLAPYLLAEGGTVRVREILRQSVFTMRGCKGAVLTLALTFLPWYLPGAGALGLLASSLFYPPEPALPYLFGAAGLCAVLQVVSYFYAAPYRMAAMAVCARALLDPSFNTDAADGFTREYLQAPGIRQFPQMP